MNTLNNYQFLSIFHQVFVLTDRQLTHTSSFNFVFQLHSQTSEDVCFERFWTTKSENEKNVSHFLAMFGKLFTWYSHCLLSLIVCCHWLLTVIDCWLSLFVYCHCLLSLIVYCQCLLSFFTVISCLLTLIVYWHCLLSLPVLLTLIVYCHWLFTVIVYSHC